MDNNTTKSSGLSGSTIAVIIIISAVIIGGLLYYGRSDSRTQGERVGNAIDAVPQGLDKAAAQLQDRTGQERANDDLSRTSEQVQSDYAQASADIQANLDKQKLKRAEAASASSASSSSQAKKAY